MPFDTLLLSGVLGLGAIAVGVYSIYLAFTEEEPEIDNPPTLLEVVGVDESLRAQRVYAVAFGGLLCFIGVVTISVGLKRRPFGWGVGAWSLLLGWFSLDFLVGALFSDTPEQDLPVRRGEEFVSEMRGGVIFRRTAYAIMGLSGLLLTAIGVLGFTNGGG